MAITAPGLSATASAQTQAPRTVLTIHWGAEIFPGVQVFDKAIREVLQADTDRPVNYHSEHLESEEFPAESASLALRDYIRWKFQGRRIDVVITTATPALQFALNFSQDLFPNVPIIFSAGLMPDIMLKDRPSGVTGIVNDVAFDETVQLALSLHPSTKRVFVVAQSPTSVGYDERVRAALQPFSQRVAITYIREPSISRLLATVKSLPAQSFVFYTRYVPDDASTVYTDEIARLMAQVSPVPIYGSTDLYMGTGIVGGMVRASRANATRLGEISRQILNGTRPEDIPIGAVSLVPMFDWRQVQRWGIDPSKLPPGSDIRFRVPSAWETYRSYIVGALVVITGQLLLITALLTQRARRRHAEATLRAQESTLRTAYERIRQMAGRLINAQESARASIARDLHDDVCQQLVCVSVSVNRLKNSAGRIQDVETQTALARLEHQTNNMFDGIRRLSHELHPSSLPLLGLGTTLKAYCSEVEKLHNVQVSFKSEGELRRLPSDVAVCLFRIAQEALRNALGHGRAERSTVSLVASGEEVELTVTDDGIGFDLEAVRRSGRGLGLVIIEERAHAVGADVQIVTGIGKGTVIRVRKVVGAAPGRPPSDCEPLSRRASARRSVGRSVTRSFS
jgi:signal transduction histidine kinase